jgi:hypothetical protein
LCAFTALKKYASSLFVTNQFSKINRSGSIDQVQQIRAKQKIKNAFAEALFPKDSANLHGFVCPVNSFLIGKRYNSIST